MAGGAPAYPCRGWSRMAAMPSCSSAKDVLSGESPIRMPCGARKSGMTSCSHKAAVISRNAGWSTVMWLPHSSGSRGVAAIRDRLQGPGFDKITAVPVN